MEQKTHESPYRIIIRVWPEYAREHSQPDQHRFVFIYTIAIHNEGPSSVQLLGRHWIITDANGKVDEVDGEGVVGEQPIIPPGGEHRYSSFCVLETAIGCMEGWYRMLAADGTHFNAPIAPFSLAVPESLN